MGGNTPATPRLVSSPPPPPFCFTELKATLKSQNLVISSSCDVSGVRSGVQLLVFHMGTWGFSLGEARQRNLYIS